MSMKWKKNQNQTCRLESFGFIFNENTNISNTVDIYKLFLKFSFLVLQGQNAPYLLLKYKNIFWDLESLAFSLLKVLYLQNSWSNFCFFLHPCVFIVIMHNKCLIELKSKFSFIMRSLSPAHGRMIPLFSEKKFKYLTSLFVLRRFRNKSLGTLEPESPWLAGIYLSGERYRIVTLAWLSRD